MRKWILRAVLLGAYGLGFSAEATEDTATSPGPLRKIADGAGET